MSQPRKSSRKKHQTQLGFSPLPSSSPALSQYPEQIQRRAAAVRYDSDMSPTKKRRVANYSTYRLPFSPASSAGKRQVQIVIPSPSKKYEQLLTPAASSQVREEDLVEDSEDGLPPIDQSRAHANGANGEVPILGSTTKTLEGDNTLDLTSEEDNAPDGRGRMANAASVISSGEKSHNRVAPEPVTPKRRLRNYRTLPMLASSPSSETDANPLTRQLRHSLSEPPESQPDTNQSTPKRGRSRGDNAKNVPEPLVISSENEEELSEDNIITPVRRRRGTAIVQSTPQRKPCEGDEVQELNDDVADLSDTVLRKTRTRGRQDTSERSKRQRKLEELRQRRAGITAETDDEEGAEYTEDDSESEYEPIEYAMRRGSNLDKYEDDFLDDENDTVGVDLGVAGVPLEYTYHANKKPFAHFKAEVEWMVHNKLNPAFERRDEIYLLAHDKLDTEVKQLGSAKFSSSVWNEAFLKSLKTRPDFYKVDIPTMFENKCDACQRSNHPPKHKVTFTGKPYNRETLETIDKDDDDAEDDSQNVSASDDDDDGDNFLLGRFCSANAEMAHALHHWRYSLNQTVLQWLAEDGQLTPAKIIERANMGQKKQEKASNKVVDSMETTGVMKQLYKQFKENLEAARNAKPHHYSGRH